MKWIITEYKLSWTYTEYGNDTNFADDIDHIYIYNVDMSGGSLIWIGRKKFHVTNVFMS